MARASGPVNHGPGHHPAATGAHPHTIFAWATAVRADPRICAGHPWTVPGHPVVVTAHPETKLVFQPGTYKIRLGHETLKAIYEVTEIFFCNKEEAQSILETKEKDVPTLIREFKKLGPKMPVITDGPVGAFVVDDDDQAWHMPMYPDPAPPVDRTGAGDSFSSTFTSAIARGKSPAEALTWGPVNSMSVVQHIGAQKGLVTMDELLEYLKNAPEDYVAKKVH